MRLSYYQINTAHSALRRHATDLLGRVRKDDTMADYYQPLYECAEAAKIKFKKACERVEELPITAGTSLMVYLTLGEMHATRDAVHALASEYEIQQAKHRKRVERLRAKGKDVEIDEEDEREEQAALVRVDRLGHQFDAMIERAEAAVQVWVGPDEDLPPICIDEVLRSAREVIDEREQLVRKLLLGEPRAANTARKFFPARTHTNSDDTSPEVMEQAAALLRRARQKASREE